MNRFGLAVVAGLGAVAMAALPAAAATITFDFTTSGGTVIGSGNNLTRTYTSGGVTLVARAFSLSGSATTSTFSAAHLGFHNGNGFGVCNQTEGGAGCSSPSHQIDNYNGGGTSSFNSRNSGQIDFVLFQLDPAAQIDRVIVRAYGSSNGTNDADASFFLGNTANPLNLVGVQRGQLGTVGFTSSGSDNIDRAVHGPTNAVDFTLPGAYNLLLIGAKIGESNDGFKIQSLTIQYTPPPPPGVPVPEPMSLALFGLGLLGLRAVSRHPA